MERFSAYCLDKLKVCYLADGQDLYETINQLTSLYDRVFKDSFPFEVHSKVERNSKCVYTLILPFGYGHPHSIEVGDMIVDNDYYNPERKNETLVYFQFKNPFLYSYHHSYSIPETLRLIEDSFALTFRNISSCEVALDVDFNASECLIANIRDLNYDLIVLSGKSRDPEEIIDPISYEIRGNRYQFLTCHTRVRGFENSFQFYIYDKLRACEAQDKEYILEHHGFTGDTLWRMECRVDYRHLKQYMKHFDCSMYEFLYNYLLEDSKLSEVWDFLSRKFVRFRKSRSKIFNPYQAALIALEEGKVIPSVRELEFTNLDTKVDSITASSTEAEIALLRDIQSRYSVYYKNGKVVCSLKMKNRKHSKRSVISARKKK